MQFSLLTIESKWKPPAIRDLPSWENAKRVCIDVETRDEKLTTLGIGSRRGGYSVGWGFAIEGGQSFYLPFRHEDGSENMDMMEVLSYLRHNAKVFRGEIVGANLSYDLDYASADGIKFHPDVIFRDIQIAAPLILETHFSYSLDNIGKRLGIVAKEDKVLNEAATSMGLHPKRDLWRLPARFVGEYAQNDVTAPLEIYAAQRKLIDENNLWKIFNIESKILPILVKQRQRGVRIDLDKLEKIEKWSVIEEQKAIDIIKDRTGVAVALSDCMKVPPFLPVFEKLGIKLELTPTGKPKIDAAFLEQCDDPVTHAIRRMRRFNKLRTTFSSSIRDHLIDGRIHCTFNQIAREDEKGEQKGGRYGRFSCTDPNLQQQPSPDKDPELGGEWRKIFLPEEGALWACHDYSQQEPRWVAHFAAAFDLPRGKEVAKRYKDDPTMDSHDMMTKLIHGDELFQKWMDTGDTKTYKQSRNYAKQIFLGLCYGQGGRSVAEQIGFSTRWALFSGTYKTRQTHYFETQHDAIIARNELGDGKIVNVAGAEGQEILDKFNREVPYVGLLTKRASQAAEKRGYVKTVMGRRLHFKKNDDGSIQWAHKALNRVIQGSSADQVKIAMIAYDNANIFTHIGVHDEIDSSFGTVEEAQKAGKLMEESILDYMTPEVPFKVDCEVGPNWSELK